MIRIQGVTKRYHLGSTGRVYTTLREELMRMLSLRRVPRSVDSEERTLLALRDVTLDVHPGEVVGIIGRNGAGKSTLLKIVSRITDPTAGRIELHGRVGSLLEVGTGFHPELTGRENIFLNGSILGMRTAEIQRQFDEIVAFAEVERFLDTPVKHYSSGMYTKLAFSVAAHLEPEILLVDEVLAVGDAAFQKKCLGKMRQVSGGGRTILFVSHNAAAVESLCSRCVWIRDGLVAGDGNPSDLLREYLTSTVPTESALVSLASHQGRTSSSRPTLLNAALLNSTGLPAALVQVGDTLGIQVQFESEAPLNPVHGFVIKTITGAALFGINNRVVQAPRVPQSISRGVLTCWIDHLPLMPGRYFIDLYFGDEYRDIDVIREALSFDVEAADVFGTGRLTPPTAGPICYGGRYEFATYGVASSSCAGAVLS